MKKSTKTIFIVILIAVIIGVVIFCFNILKKDDSIEVNKENDIEINGNEIIDENRDIEIEDETEENEIENEKTEEKQITEDENITEENNETIKNTEVLEDTGKNNEDKAIEIVKKDWDNSNGVYFVTMGMDASGKYIVTVNDSETTATLAWYSVDVNTGKFEIKQ